MKKLIISSFVLFFAISTISLASPLRNIDDEIVTSRIADNVLQHFGYNFFRASDVSWTVEKEFQKATFKLNGKTSYALYDLEGNFLVATQKCEKSELAPKVQQSLDQEYADYTLVQALKVISRASDYKFADDTNSVWLNLESNGKSLVAIVYPGNTISVVKTTTK